MNIAVIGTGYVGLVAGVCFASVGHRVVCVDKITARVNRLKEGQVPFFEPGLEQMLGSVSKQISFTDRLQEAVGQSHILFVAVGTPETQAGEADLSAVHEVVEGICRWAQEPKIIVLKSTVPVGTHLKIKEQVRKLSSLGHQVVNNPEFLREGMALDDFLRPDRVVVGTESRWAQKNMEKIYSPFFESEPSRLIFMSNSSAELAKYAANSFLSVKISFINELAKLADQLGADVEQVKEGFTSDSRISSSFFRQGSGYGGSCFPKDVQALIHTAKSHGCTMDVVGAADQVNDRQKTILVDKIIDRYKDIKGMTFALWGLAFKPNTDDVREAPARYIIDRLHSLGARVVAYDPQAGPAAKINFSTSFDLVDSAINACEGAQALLIVTEWDEFCSPNYLALADLLKEKVIFDGRNILDPLKVKSHGFEYHCVGRQCLFGPGPS